MKKFYVMFNGAAWFVKDAAYFESQGGLTEKWGKEWVPLWANSIQHARELAKADGDPREVVVSPREQFEARFPLPGAIHWDGQRYACRTWTIDNCKALEIHNARWEAWRARGELK